MWPRGDFCFGARTTEKVVLTPAPLPSAAGYLSLSLVEVL